MTFDIPFEELREKARGEIERKLSQPGLVISCSKKEVRSIRGSYKLVPRKVRVYLEVEEYIVEDKS